MQRLRLYDDVLSPEWQDSLRQEVLSLMCQKGAGVIQIAREVGISQPIMYKFLNNRGNVSHTTLFKIESYVNREKDDTQSMEESATPTQMAQQVKDMAGVNKELLDEDDNKE